MRKGGSDITPFSRSTPVPWKSIHPGQGGEEAMGQRRVSVLVEVQLEGSGKVHCCSRAAAGWRADGVLWQCYWYYSTHYNFITSRHPTCYVRNL